MRSVDDERGAIAVSVALLMVVLIGFAALAIDIGALYQERRTLQNGADAGALAVAKDCAGTGCVGFDSKADEYADLNADDGESNVDDVCGTGLNLPACPVEPPNVPGGARYVQVTTSTNDVSNPSDPTEVDFNFAPVFDLVAPGDAEDHDGRTMRATAVAAWGPPRAASTGPLTISLCDYERLVRPRFPLSLLPPFIVSTVHFNGFPSIADPLCVASLAPAPGGFGWLDVGADCEVSTAVNDWVDEQPGGSVPSCLDPDDLVGTTVIVPVHNAVRGPFLAPDEYRIVGYAAFHVTAYRAGIPDGLLCVSLNFTCLRGYFTKAITTGTDIGGPDLGVDIIKLVG